MTTQKTDKKKVFALGSTVVSCKDASTNVKTSRTTTSAWRTWPPFSIRSLSLCYDNTNPFRTRKNSSRRQMRLICNNPRRAAPPKHGQEEQRLLARIRNMLIRSKEEKRCGKRPRRGGVWADDLSLAKTPQYTDEQRGHAGISCKRLLLVSSSNPYFQV